MNYNKEEAQDALKRAQGGDQSAFAYLYEAYYQHAFIAAHDIITDFGECEDIVQDAFMRCFQVIQQGEEISGFGAYIQKTAKNVAKDHIKAREAAKRPNEVLTSYAGEDSSETEEERQLYDAERSEIQDALIQAADFYQTPEEHFEAEEIRDIIQSILEELPDYQREALSLFYLEGMKYREISELYGVSVDTVKSRVHQGKKKVEKKVVELEKTKGIKLRGLAPFVFFFVVLRHAGTAKAAELSTAELSAAAVQTAIGNTAAAGSKRSTFEAARQVTQKAFTKTFTVAGKTITGKTIAIVAAGTIATGTVGSVATQNLLAGWAESTDQIESAIDDLEEVAEDLASESMQSDGTGDTAPSGDSDTTSEDSDTTSEDAATDANIPGETFTDGWYYTNLYASTNSEGTYDMYVQDDYLVMDASFRYSETDERNVDSNGEKIPEGIYHASLEGTKVYGLADSEAGIWEEEDLQEFKDKAKSLYSTLGLGFRFHVTNGKIDSIYFLS